MVQQRNRREPRRRQWIGEPAELAPDQLALTVSSIRHGLRLRAAGNAACCQEGAYCLVDTLPEVNVVPRLPRLPDGRSRTCSALDWIGQELLYSTV